jgi:hypothetical protein
MDEVIYMSLPIAESLYAQILGWELLNHLKDEESNFSRRIDEIDSRALRILEEVRAILNDDTLDDPECLERIDRIVSLYYKNDIDTSRHNWDS